MLIAKGFDVGFELADGDEIDVSGAMLHDPDGEDWPACSLLITAFRGGGVASDVPSEAKHYLGKSYRAHVGSVKLPPKNLDDWKRVGEVAVIYYDRPGRRAPGPFRHAFGRRRWQALFRKGKLSTLFKLGRAHRLELGPKCIADDRGLVFP